MRPARKPGRSARTVRLAGAALVVTAIGWGAPKLWPKHRVEDVLTATASVGDLDIVVSDKGELESAESVQVMCEVEGGGKITTILPEGTPVKKGDVVARFDTDVLQKGINEQEVKWEQAEGKVKAAVSELEVQKNKAESEIAKAELARTLADIDLEAYQSEYQAELDKRKGTLEIGKKELKEAEDALTFTRSMAKKGFTQLEQVRVMELAFEGKKYGVLQQETDLTVFTKFTKRRKTTELEAKAKDTIRDLERTIKSQAAATEKATNEVSAARKTAELEKRQLGRLKEQLGKCEVKAPGSGIVIYFKRIWDESSRIRPGAQVFFQQPIFNLPDLGRMNVKMKVHESVVKKVRPGLQTTMKIDALPGHVLHGKVVSVATLAQGDDWRGSGVKEYETVVSIADLPTDSGLRPGMSAEVKILAKTIPGALTVPVQSVTESGGRHVCYVVTGADIERREVTIGDGSDQLVQVLEGLSAGERVALDARSRASGEAGTGPSAQPDAAKDNKDKSAKPK
ncbi:rnd family efflux transporter mfp subunit : RND family efflux transporter, MFP subunit OS=Singulisphaera acidiphila (strain ATCC BAA-1392 / DSM 18658 / VKM B-2454 / MOB10) GN=Sinac_5744 PE=4 SV=1: HlyD_2 [Gemmata massiliana]|uniref:CzcB-like C-terminal circularly permuted SH3-like domain-containing protein n=1 Tax=Gemmata massiliana TaxID=1210884 RepID=A0A6P2CYE8_9BACT|nr:rnd family efflux transporter mfp subunit : RND family efflux transporter, MFP subunit OS=Singulisphaera acidiphila (strain ATCC BAA-1392 / DSM 18658 / VKM B-2454 / MOB10) GN=Sinac_5744 PE=4 SV=1: HlyD_2 [Gemmata massiliana]